MPIEARPYTARYSSCFKLICGKTNRIGLFFSAFAAVNFSREVSVVCAGLVLVSVIS